MYKTNLEIKLLLFGLFCICLLYRVCKSEEIVYEKLYLDTVNELGISATGNIIENSRSYYKQMFGEHFEFKNTGYIFLERACNQYPITPEKMELFKDVMFAPFTSIDRGISGLHSWKRPYFPEKYCPDPQLTPSRYFLAKSQLLSDMLYWEWSVTDIQFKVLESYHGMLLWIIPKGFNAKKGISSDECAEILLKTTRIPCKDTDELQRQFQLPPALQEGDVFSNINKLEKLVNAKILLLEFQNEFPIPTEPNQWSKQLVGFISKDGICLILIHGRFPRQSFPANPTILDDESRWLSGRILLTNSKVPVLPRGLTKIPESWKPVLEQNVKERQLGLEIAEKERTEEAKWRVWYDKDGEPFCDGKKMKIVYWFKLPLDHQPDLRYKEGTVRLDMREGGSTELPLSLFNKDDKKQIMSVPPKKLVLSKEIQAVSPIDEEKPKPVEPKKDDIE